MKIGLLICDHVAAKFQPLAGDYPEMFAGWLQDFSPQIQLEFFDVCRNQFPRSPDSCHGYITTGSRRSVYENEPWISTLRDFVRCLAQEQRPFVGICFGHQILAESLGGKTLKSPSGWGVGVHDLNIISSEDWMRPPASRCGLQYMHQDQVVRMPENSLLLAESDHCPIAMFRVGEKMLGIQAHPEFKANYVHALLQDRIELIGSPRIEEGIASLARKTDEATITRWIVEFLTIFNRE